MIELLFHLENESIFVSKSNQLNRCRLELRHFEHNTYTEYEMRMPSYSFLYDAKSIWDNRLSTFLLTFFLYQKIKKKYINSTAINNIFECTNTHQHWIQMHFTILECNRWIEYKKSSMLLNITKNLYKYIWKIDLYPQVTESFFFFFLYIMRQRSRRKKK